MQDTLFSASGKIWDGGGEEAEKKVCRKSNTNIQV